MFISKIKITSVSIATVAIFALSALPAAALSVGASVDASVSASAAGTNASADASASAKLSTVITRADADVAARITALNNLSTRVAAMKNESAAEKASIASQVETNITGLTALKAKIDADTTAAAASTDAKTIFTAYRIYALVIPQGWIIAAGDRVTTIDNLMTSLAAKIQARVSADQAAGKNVAALITTLADMNAKVTDANAQSASAQADVSALVPDQGNASIAASNKTALVASRAKIKTATDDLKAARKDVTALLAGLKSLGNVSASASTSASIQ